MNKASNRNGCRFNTTEQSNGSASAPPTIPTVANSSYKLRAMFAVAIQSIAQYGQYEHRIIIYSLKTCSTHTKHQLRHFESVAYKTFIWLIHLNHLKFIIKMRYTFHCHFDAYTMNTFASLRCEQNANEFPFKTLWELNWSKRFQYGKLSNIIWITFLYQLQKNPTYFQHWKYTIINLHTK